MRARADRALPKPTESEAAFDALLATFGRPVPADVAGAGGLAADTSAAGVPATAGAAGREPAPNEFLERLYAQREQFLEKDRFASIGDAGEFFTKAVGVTFEGRQDVIGGLLPGSPLELRREPDNPHDTNAVLVVIDGKQVAICREKRRKTTGKTWAASLVGCPCTW